LRQNSFDLSGGFVSLPLPFFIRQIRKTANEFPGKKETNFYAIQEIRKRAKNNRLFASFFCAIQRAQKITSLFASVFTLYSKLENGQKVTYL